MPAYLNVTDEGVLSESSVQAIATVFPKRTEAPGGGVGGEPLPTHLGGGTRAHVWASPFYNAGSPSVSLIRGGIAAARYAQTDFELVVPADSRGQGYNAGADQWLNGWVGQLRQMLGAVEGTIMAFTSDSRWATNMLNGATDVPGLARGTVDPDTTFTFSTPHTGGSFWVVVPAGGVVTVAVDGGAAQSFTVPAGNGLKKITPTVTGTGTHTYTVKSTVMERLVGFRPTYAGPKLKVTNLSRSGTTAESWRPGFNTTQTGLWDVLVAMTVPNAIIGSLGTNQRSDPAGNATQLTAWWAAVAGLNVPTAGEWAPQYLAQIAAADTHNFPLIDGVSVIGDGVQAAARGLMFDDRHENRKGFSHVAAAVAALLRVQFA